MVALAIPLPSRIVCRPYRPRCCSSARYGHRKRALRAQKMMPLWHRLRPRDMSVEAKRCRHVAVAIPVFAIACRPEVLDQTKMALAQRMHASGESAATIAQTLRVSRVTVYRALADQNLKGD